MHWFTATFLQIACNSVLLKAAPPLHAILGEFNGLWGVSSLYSAPPFSGWDTLAPPGTPARCGLAFKGTRVEEE